MMCNDKELLIGYVYGELDDAQRAAVERHVAACDACRDEAAELRGMRHHLASWAPPERDLGFRIVHGTDAPAAAPSRFRFSPAWGLAAAAVLVLAAASAIANLEVRYDSNGLVVRTGWARTAPATETPTEIAGVDSKAEFERVDRRLQQLETAAASRESATMANAAGPRLTDTEVIRQVRLMLSESEGRQRREVVRLISQVVRDFDMTRRADFVRFQQGLGNLQDVTTSEAAQQREMLNYLMRVSTQK